jgi:hypothetical protein
MMLSATCPRRSLSATLPARRMPPGFMSCEDGVVPPACFLPPASYAKRPSLCTPLPRSQAALCRTCIVVRSATTQLQSSPSACTRTRGMRYSRSTPLGRRLVSPRITFHPVISMRSRDLEMLETPQRCSVSWRLEDLRLSCLSLESVDVRRHHLRLLSSETHRTPC